MNKIKRILAICLTMVMSLGILEAFSIQVYAYENNNLHNSINAKVDYYEYYVKSGSNNKFTSRSVMAVYATAAATSTPYLTLGNVKHSNDKIFNKWSTISIIYDGDKWDNGFGKENTEAVTYAATTNITGKLAFLLSCDGAIPPTVAGSVDLSLKTN